MTRINNIELIKETEFVKWYPNPDYNKQEEYLKAGAVLEGEFIVSYYAGIKWSQHISCFKSPENCFTVAFLEKKGDGEYKLISVSNRLVDLTYKEIKDLFKIYKEFVKSKNNTKQDGN